MLPARARKDEAAHIVLRHRFQQLGAEEDVARDERRNVRTLMRGKVERSKMADDRRLRLAHDIRERAAHVHMEIDTPAHRSGKRLQIRRRAHDGSDLPARLDHALREMLADKARDAR